MSTVPVGTLTIDGTNPLAAGLVACYVPGSTNGLVDLCGNGPALTLGAGASIGTTGYGKGLISNGTSSQATAGSPIPAAWQLTTAGTIFSALELTGTPVASTTVVGVIQNSSNASPFNSYLLSFDGSTQLNFSYNHSGTFASLQTSTAMPSGMHTAAATFTVGGAITIYQDASNILGGTWSVSAPTYSGTAAIQIGGDLTTPSRILNGNTAIVLIYNRALSASEISSLNTNPFQFLLVSGITVTRDMGLVLDVLAGVRRDAPVATDWLAAVGAPPVLLTTPGSGTWPVPANCPAGTVLTVEAWGGGGSGSNSITGGGGGGAAYSRGTYTVTSADVASGIPYYLANGGAAATSSTGNAGENTWWASSTTILAAGGGAGSAGSGGAGAQTSACIGTFKNRGGVGSANHGAGGSGGPDGVGASSSATNTGAGGDFNLGGAGGTDGVAGGDNVLGGGGGGRNGAGGSPGGGSGAASPAQPGGRGQIRITYATPGAPTPIELTASLVRDASSPLEIQATQTSDGALPTDWLAPVTRDAPAPTDWLAPLTRDASALVEIGATAARSVSIPTDILASIQRDAASPIDWTGTLGVTRDVVIPLEFLGGVATTAAQPIDWLALLARDATAATDWSATVRRDTPAATDWTAGVTRDSASPLEILTTRTADTALPVAWQVTVLRDTPLPTDWSGALAVTRDMPLHLDWTAPVSADLAAPVEIIASITASRTAPLETLLAARRDTTAPLATLATVRLDAPLPTDWTASLALDGNGQIAWTASVVRDMPLPTDWTGGVIVTSDIALPLDWSVLVLRDVPVALAWLGTSIITGREVSLPPEIRFVPLWPETRTVSLPPETGMNYGIGRLPPRWSPMGPTDSLWNWFDLTDFIAITYPGDAIDLSMAPTAIVTPSGPTVSAVQVTTANGLTKLGVQVSGLTVGTDYAIEFTFKLLNSGTLTRGVSLFGKAL